MTGITVPQLMHRVRHPQRPFVLLPKFKGWDGVGQVAAEKKKKKAQKIPQKEWLPAPVFLSGESHGQRSLAGYSPWHRKE